MTALDRMGETARAVAHYEEELTRLLADQVGVPPSAETTALYQRLRARSRSLAGAGSRGSRAVITAGRAFRVTI